MRSKLPLSFHGFTLIELLVSVLVVSILVSLGYAAFRRYSQKQVVWSMARKIEGDLRKAQSYAMAGKDANACVDSRLFGYQFRYVDNSSYLIRGVCGFAGSYSFVGESEIPVPSPLGITNFNGTADAYGLDGIVFYSPKGNTNLADDRIIAISMISGGSIVYSVRVIVSPGGKIFISE